jgi:hypothetical protein
MGRSVDGLMIALNEYDTGKACNIDQLLSHACRVDHGIIKRHQLWIIALYHSIVYIYDETAEDISAASNGGYLSSYIVSIYTAAHNKRHATIEALAPVIEIAPLITIVNDYAFPMDTYCAYKNSKYYIASAYGRDKDRATLMDRSGNHMV